MITARKIPQDSKINITTRPINLTTIIRLLVMAQVLSELLWDSVASSFDLEMAEQAVPV